MVFRADWPLQWHPVDEDFPASIRPGIAGAAELRGLGLLAARCCNQANGFDESTGVRDNNVTRPGQREVDIGLILRAVAVRLGRPDVAAPDFCTVRLLMVYPPECQCNPLETADHG